MKAVLQRVQEASVSINGDVVSHISKGFLYGYLRMKTES